MARRLTALDELVDLLDLEEIEVNLFRGRSPQEGSQRVFGGQVAGQALVAAGRTVDEGAVHSLHAYFIRGGTSAEPVRFEVDRIRNGRSFLTRRVVARQSNGAILNLSASFQVEEEAPDVAAVERPRRLDPRDLVPRQAVVGHDLDLGATARALFDRLHGEDAVGVDEEGDT